jgi:alkaline phosphatase D
MEPTGEGPRRTFGVARILPASSSRFRQPVFFKMNPNFDMTGVVMFDDLLPETEYVYQMGYIFSDLDLEDLGPDYPLDWSGIRPGTGAAKFRTGATDGSRPRSFVFGSCRYLLRLFGGLWFDSRGDKTFRSILRQIDGGAQTDLLVMLGDQIYADDLNVIAPDETLDEYNARYRAAFSLPHIRELMSRMPTYMTLDDHEIEDAWPAHASTRDWMVKYPSAVHSYLTYQASHSPLMTMSGPNRMLRDRYAHGALSERRPGRTRDRQPPAIGGAERLAGRWLRAGQVRGDGRSLLPGHSLPGRSGRQVGRFRGAAHRGSGPHPLRRCEARRVPGRGLPSLHEG